MNIRLLPVAIFVAVLMLGVKASDIWLGIEMLAISPSHAQQATEQKPDASAAKPAAKRAGAKKAKNEPQKADAQTEDEQKAKAGDGTAGGAAAGKSGGGKSAATDRKDGFH